MLYQTDWASIKEIRTDNGSLEIYYTQDGSTYTVVVGDRNQVYWSVLRESADITDFETTYKAGGTSVLSLDDAISNIFLDQDQAEEIVSAIDNADILTVGGVQGALTVGTSAVEAKVGGSRYANRKLLTIMPIGTKPIYYGFTSGVTTSTGTQIFKKQLLTIRIGDIPLYLISDTAGQTVQITEAT